MPKTPFYITTAIDYPNAKPHIGHAYEKIIADMIARWHMLKGDDVFFLTGTDEHGQKIEKTAKEKGKEPRVFVDELSEDFKKAWAGLNIQYSEFIRTTQKRHVKTAREIFAKVFAKGLIYKGTYRGLYCTGCEAFYTDKDLVDGVCPIHQRKAEEVSEESYFFKLGEFQAQLIQHIEGHPEFIRPESRKNEILSRLKEPLRDLSVSRVSLKWGIPLEQDKKHTMYVWFDALTNYLSGVSYPTRKFQKYWPASCQMIGKDITWFHTVIWPIILLAAELALPKTVYSHGFLTVNGQKISKSIGNVVDPLEVAKKFGADPIRYYLAREIPAGEDGDFSESVLIDHNNAELADALGNLLQRTSVLIHKNFQGNIPICGKITDKEKELESAIPDMAKLNELMDKYEWHHVVELIWNYINRCNKYVNDTEPWKQTSDPDRLATILYTLVEHLRIISILVWPIIPGSAEKIASQIGQPLGKFKDVKFRKTTKGTVSQPQILFKKVEKEGVQSVVTKPKEPAGPVDPFAKLNLKVAKVEFVENHPNADKLYVLKLDAGSEKRQLVAGMKQFYKPEELVGKHIVFISNLKPAQLRGVESQGMMLAGEKDGKVLVLEAHGSIPGESVFVEGIPIEQGQITIDDFQKVVLTTLDKNVVYQGKVLTTKSGTVRVDLPNDAKIR